MKSGLKPKQGSEAEILISQWGVAHSRCLRQFTRHTMFAGFDLMAPPTQNGDRAAYGASRKAACGVWTAAYGSKPDSARVLRV
jgi:hypothetical protein